MIHPSPRSGQAPTILVVDDDAGFREILRANFEVVGFDVVDAGASSYERIGERAALVRKEAKRRRGSVVVTERELTQR